MIQLQNFVSLTTTGTSGAATLSNGVLNVPNYDTSGSAWVDYSATSTIVGWSSFTSKIIRYRIIGKQLFFQVILNGTSNSTSVTFTLPFNAANIGSTGVYRLTNNGALGNGIYDITTGSSTCTCYSTVTASSWTASGTKLIYFQGFIEIA